MFASLLESKQAFSLPRSRLLASVVGSPSWAFRVARQPEAIAITSPQEPPKNLSLFQLPFPVGINRNGLRALLSTGVDDEPLPIRCGVVLAVVVMHMGDGAAE